MRNSVIILLAFRNLWGRKSRTLITISGITIGIATVVFLLSLGYGLQRVVTTGVSDLNALKVVNVTPVKSTAQSMNEEMIKKMKDFAHVTDVQGVVNLAGKVSSPDAKSSSDTVIYGANSAYLQLAGVHPPTGKIYDDNSKSVLANKSVLNLISINEEDAIGKTIAISVFRTRAVDPNQQDEAVELKDNFTISGILNDSGSPFIYLPVSYLLANEVTLYQQLKVQIDSRDNLDNVRKNIENLGFKTESIADTVSQIDQFFSVVQLILGLFGVIAVMVAVLGMFNTLTVSLLERTREIGIIKTIGASSHDVMRLFLTEATIIALFGGVVGVNLGWLIGIILNKVLVYVAISRGSEPATIFFTPPTLVMISICAITLVGLLTGLFPARRASKLNPLNALRYE